MSPTNPSSMVRVVGIDFSHMHMGDNLKLVAEHPQCELVAICDSDPQRMADAIGEHQLTDEQVFTDIEACLNTTKPDLAVLCPSTADHAEVACEVLQRGVPVLIEKPFAASLADADRMIAVAEQSGCLLAINWPMVWYPSHRTAKRLVEEGTIGRVREIHYYDGNRGPLYHTAHKHEVTPEEVVRQKPDSWFYKREHGGGSLLDYLGYGVTLGTWLNGEQRPLAVTTVVDEPVEFEVDEHSVTVVRYEAGLSKFETRWGTFTDPWTHQPQPKCGFVIVGEQGTISSYDFAATIRVQTAEKPEGAEVAVDRPASPNCNPIEYVVYCLQSGQRVEGPLSPAVSRLGQVIVDAAVQSAAEKCTIDIN